MAWSSRRKLRTALRHGRIARIARNRYALPDVETGSADAPLHGVASHLSAARHWQWAVKAPPARPHVAVPRGRKVDPRMCLGVAVHRLRLAEHDVRGAATSPLRTIIDCARDLPFDDALAVADSALREGSVSKHELVAAAALVRGPGARAVRRVAAHADGRAANPFESALRAAAIECGLAVTLQLPIAIGGIEVHPDVVDVSRRLVALHDADHGRLAGPAIHLGAGDATPRFRARSPVPLGAGARRTYRATRFSVILPATASFGTSAGTAVAVPAAQGRPREALRGVTGPR